METVILCIDNEKITPDNLNDIFTGNRAFNTDLSLPKIEEGLAQ